MTGVRLAHEPIAVPALLREVAADGAGATALFLGTVRDTNDGRPVEGIEYTAYERMAIAELERIVGEAVERHPGTAIVVVHRIGTLTIGDISVAIACSNAHRAAALDANRYVIEELKRRVPIWKRERYLDGTLEWVDPTRARSGSGV
jgi:molybdopterin synthase catalytic subunit